MTTDLLRACERILVTALVLLLAACAPEAEPEDPELPSALVGTWRRILPDSGPPDTLTLKADGGVVGSSTGLAMTYQPTYWRVGAKLMSDGLCIGDGDQAHTSAFRLAGDTLMLANQVRAVFVRVPPTGLIDRARAFRRPARLGGSGLPPTVGGGPAVRLRHPC